ncbi:MAG: hypothetical protein CL693_13325 [Cellvibrionaceae bacterium]|nr:hypothetical protein [Cellvibrionaceae bacterium]
MTIPSHQQLLTLSNNLLALLGILFLLSIALAYSSEQIPMTVQILAHILIIISSAAIKLCYLARITAQKALNLKVC